MIRLTALFLLALTPALGWAQSVSAAAARAFSYAAPGIQQAFGTPENFMAMVRAEYAVVYRPRSVSFDTPVMAAGELVQPVHMTDVDGRAWLALYPMERQPDGRWRINGCQLARLPARQT